MSKRIVQALPLSDQYGQWCAWCCEYAKPSELQDHHVFGRGHKKSADPVVRAALEVTIPVHGRCHRHHSVIGISAASVSTFFSQDLPTMTAELVSARGQRNYSHGNMNPALVQRRHERLVLASEPDIILCGKELSALSVSRALRSFGRWYLNDMAAYVHSSVEAEPVLLQHGSNVFLNRETGVGTPKAMLDRASSMERLSKSDLARRNAKLTFRVDQVEQALRAAVDTRDIYAERTTRNMLGWARLKDGNPVAAIEHFHLVIDDRRTTRPLSWWHLMMAYLGLGIARFMDDERGGFAVSIRYLQMSEYIGSVLGLHPSRIADVRRESPEPAVALRPRHFVRWVVEKRGLSDGYARRRLFEQRIIGIVQNIRDPLFQTVRES